MSEVTTSIILETRTRRKSGQYPVKLRLTFERKQKYFSVIIKNKRLSLTKKNFETIMTSKKRSEIRKNLDEFIDKADEVINELEPFSFQEFNAKWNSNKDEENDLFKGFKSTVARLKKENRVGTALAYETAMNSFKSYVGQPSLKYNQITIKWLNDFVVYMHGNGKSTTTTSIYLRTLRVIIRSEGKSFVKVYPFDGFNMPISKGRKNEALNIDQVLMLALYKTNNSMTQKALDFWLFSYNCGGANYEDLFRLSGKILI